ncbi:MAG: SDR family oxidoreductase [Alphaproteobacteria bacterium]|nr:SDR family oxidoreductase [Alphaproteobacteria bacterium]
MGDRLKGKVVCITGAGRGLGKALAQAFDAEGARLALAARTTPELDALVATLQDAIAIQTDVREPREVQALIDAAVGEFGTLDVMINNAGLAVYGPVGSYTPDEINRVIDTNVKGVIHGSQAAFKVMKENRTGFIINISSIAGKLHLPNESVYSASKWAVNGFTGTLWLEARKHGIKVAAVCPGGVNTPFWTTQEFLPFPDRIDPERDFMNPAEVARTVVELVATTREYVITDVVMQPLLF